MSKACRCLICADSNSSRWDEPTLKECSGHKSVNRLTCFEPHDWSLAQESSGKASISHRPSHNTITCNSWSRAANKISEQAPRRRSHDWMKLISIRPKTKTHGRECFRTTFQGAACWVSSMSWGLMTGCVPVCHQWKKWSAVQYIELPDFFHFFPKISLQGCHDGASVLGRNLLWWAGGD